MADGSVVLFQWGVSSYFGWGVYGLNLMLAWAHRTDLRPASLMPIDPAAIDVDPLELRLIQPAMRRSALWQAELAQAAGKTATTSRLVLEIVQNGVAPATVAHGATLHGSPSIGVAFIEQSSFDGAARHRLRRYPLVVAGSRWNRDLLREAGAHEVALVLQGVDTSHFHPAPRRGLFPGRFVVFSGGKLEFRKGQDLVLRAFRAFAQRHAEAMLLTCWGSPWPELAGSLAYAGLTAPGFGADGQVDAAGWTRANGIPDHQVVHCGAVPNRAMPPILREADVAVFTSRAEGGTNLVAMECMACGVPTLLSANTGHLDLLDGKGAIGLQRQTAVAGPDFVGWGGTDVDEIVAALEVVYARPDDAQETARRGATILAKMTWRTQMDRLADLLGPYSRG